MPRGLFDKLASVKDRIARAALRSGRSPESVDLLAVTKNAAPEAVRELLAAGAVHHVGENRVQDAIEKFSGLGPRAPALHLIGHLQANKAKRAAALFDWIDSLDDLALAGRLEREAATLGKTLRVLVQVQPEPNPGQSGVQPDALADFLAQARAYPHLEVRGLLAIAPFTDPVEGVRPHCRRLKRLLDRHFPATPGRPAPVLSMGMSRDFEIAVEEGATMVRIGSLIFGPAAFNPRGEV